VAARGTPHPCLVEGCALLPFPLQGGSTPLHWAADNGRVTVASLLLADRRVNASAKTNVSAGGVVNLLTGDGPTGDAGRPACRPAGLRLRWLTGARSPRSSGSCVAFSFFCLITRLKQARLFETVHTLYRSLQLGATDAVPGTLLHLSASGHDWVFSGWQHNQDRKRPKEY